MSYINENFLELQESYLFSTIAKKVAKFTEENPDNVVPVACDTVSIKNGKLGGTLGKHSWNMIRLAK